MTEGSFNFTQNILIRTDLKVSKGKLCGQVAHAAVSAADAARKNHSDWWMSWMEEGQRKVVLRARNLEELHELKRKAEEFDLPVALIEDRGLTELPPGTITCLGIGPAPTQLVDKVTRNLRLL